MSDGSPAAGNRECELFLAALDQPTPEARSTFLDAACGADRELRSAVETLLRNHRADEFLERPALNSPRPGMAGPGPAATALMEPGREQPGDRIGRYKLLQSIGEGGVGTVFMAEQEEPVRRRVALKVLKPGMDTRSVIARFETERQALALMDHPGIAKVLDAGSTATGRPYFVMELVRGIRITDYCDQNRLSTRDRLGLFVQVCAAIQHAHQKGIVHRDIKPSNLLVALHDSRPAPKVIDFGIAKALDQRLTDKTCFTEFQAFIGTPAYMSPEQAEMSGLDIDTRTDVYSLGVLLYELLTGQTPFDARALLATGLDALRRALREQEPVRPSTRLGTLAEAERAAAAGRQQSEPARLVRLLRGDLDWIVLKALEKDRTHRYDTAEALAADVQRYLDNQPILARPPNAGYRFRKFVRRNKLGFAASAAFAAALLVGLGLTTWQFLEKSAAEQAEQALRRTAQAQAEAFRRRAYVADLLVVQQALAANNLGRARERLEAQRPGAGQADLRGWEWRYLWQQCQSDARFVLCQVSNEVSALAISADGRLVAVGDSEGGLRVWDAHKRQPMAELASGGSLGPVAFSPAGSVLAFSSAEGAWFPSRNLRIRLWDGAERRFTVDLAIGDACLALAFSADGRRLRAVTAGGQARLWSLPDGTGLATRSLALSGRPGSAAAIAPGLDRAAVTTEGGAVSVVNLDTGQVLWTVTAAEERVTALAFASDGRILASGAGYVESAIRLWDAASGGSLGRLEGHRSWVSSLAFGPGSRTLVSGSGDQTLRLWDLEAAASDPERPAGSGAGRSVVPLPAGLRSRVILRGHRQEVWSLAVAPDRTTVVSGCKDGSVYVWDAGQRPRDRAHVVLPEPVQAWRLGADGRSVQAVDLQGRLVRWHGPAMDEREVEAELGIGVFSALFSPDMRWVAVGLTNGMFEVWDVERRSRVRQWTAEAEGVRSFPVGFLPPSDHLVTRRLGQDAFQEWDLESGEEVQSWLAALEPGPRSAVAFSTDGRWFFLLDADGAARLRDLGANRETVFDLGLKQIGQVAFSPSGNTLVAVSRLGLGGLWETAGPRKVATLSGFLQGMNSAAFSPDGRRLAVGGDGAEAVKVWETETWEEVLTLEGTGSLFQSTGFSADGLLLAACNGRGYLHLWRVPTLAEIDRARSGNR
jgi:serine/threonine protein kinase/WD40 repeat protein